MTMSMSTHLSPLVALIVGILILIFPRFLNYFIAVYLIITGLIGLGALRTLGGPEVCFGRLQRAKGAGYELPTANNCPLTTGGPTTGTPFRPTLGMRATCVLVAQATQRAPERVKTRRTP